jgi:mono/diheme cytochrome c family protein
MTAATSMFLFASCAVLSAQTKTVLEGVYSPAQAARGEAAYAANCAKCHEGADVDGPPLTGDPFMDRWREDTLTTLFTFIKTRMPQDSPGKLSETAYLDILAHILQSNSIPAGTKELTAGELPAIVLVGKDGPKPLPANSLVRMAGCLTTGANGAWMLSSAGDPARARDAEQTPDDLKDAASMRLGKRSFRLQNIADLQPAFDADANKNKRVLAKGVLIPQANNDRINVTALIPTGQACTP